MVPPRGDGGTASRPLSAGSDILVPMRTQALRVTVGAYSDGTWHVAMITDYYERGVLVHSELEELAHPKTREDVRRRVGVLLDVVMQREDDRIRREAERPTQAVGRSANSS